MTGTLVYTMYKYYKDRYLVFNVYEYEEEPRLIEPINKLIE